MAMPTDLILVRHGQSEANVVQKEEKRLGHSPRPEAQQIFERHDSEQRLTMQGVAQAATAGAWLAKEHLLPRDFDGRFVSPYFRTMETAAGLDPDATWLPEARLVERDWGEYGSTPGPDRGTRFPDTERMKEASAFFARMAGGESVFDTSFRVREFLGMCSREYENKRVIAVAHGEVMWATRFVIERLTPHEWQQMDEDKTQRIGNCTVLQYTRINPIHPDDVAPSLSSGWRRITDPVEGKSPYRGEWHRLPGKRLMTADELHDAIKGSPRLLGDQ